MRINLRLQRFQFIRFVRNFQSVFGHDQMVKPLHHGTEASSKKSDFIIAVNVDRHVQVAGLDFVDVSDQPQQRLGEADRYEQGRQHDDGEEDEADCHIDSGDTVCCAIEMLIRRPFNQVPVHVGRFDPVVKNHAVE
ncbi:hypothetical protein D3C78_865680 [compost metagenome]